MYSEARSLIKNEANPIEKSSQENELSIEDDEEEVLISEELQLENYLDSELSGFDDFEEWRKKFDSENGINDIFDDSNQLELIEEIEDVENEAILVVRDAKIKMKNEIKINESEDINLDSVQTGVGLEFYSKESKDFFESLDGPISLV